jgi:hypothetical protein
MVSLSVKDQQDGYTELRPLPNWGAGLLIVSALALNFIGLARLEPSEGLKS